LAARPVLQERAASSGLVDNRRHLDFPKGPCHLTFLSTSMELLYGYHIAIEHCFHGSS
jgi:hypothetical protein